MSSEARKASLAEYRGNLGSHYYTEMIRASIHSAVEDAITWQTQFNQVFPEMLTMIDRVECDENGDQEIKNRDFTQK